LAKSKPATTSSGSRAAQQVASAILGFIAEIPNSRERKSRTPDTASRKVANSSAAAAALAAGTLALPPGPLGWITILPEMIAVWKIQSQMVSDIASLHGKKATLTQAQMLYCLFRHSAAQAVRDLVVRVGERTLVRGASLRVLQTVAQKVGVKVTQRAIGRGLSRWLPIVGAVGVGAYAYYDTVQVAGTAIELFEYDIGAEPAVAEDA
jgi:hypothetical protein